MESLKAQDKMLEGLRETRLPSAFCLLAHLFPGVQQATVVFYSINTVVLWSIFPVFHHRQGPAETILIMNRGKVVGQGAW